MTTATSSPLDTGATAAGRPLRLDPTPKRVRVVHAGAVVGDSARAWLGYASGRHPEYLLPADDVRLDSLLVDDAAGDGPFGPARRVRTRAGERSVGRQYVSGPAAGTVAFEFELMDAWFEEDEQIFFHPRDP